MPLTACVEFVAEPVVPDAVHPGDLVYYRGTFTELHGICRVNGVIRLGSTTMLRLAHPCGKDVQTRSQGVTLLGRQN